MGDVQDLRRGGQWMDPCLGRYSVRGLMFVIAIHLSPMAVHCFSPDYMGKQPVAWQEYFAEYWSKERKESMDRCSGHHDITEIMLKKWCWTQGNQSPSLCKELIGKEKYKSVNKLMKNNNQCVGQCVIFLQSFSLLTRRDFTSAKMETLVEVIQLFNTQT